MRVFRANRRSRRGLERELLKENFVKTNSENQSPARPRRSRTMPNTKLLLAALRLWELKRRTAAKTGR